MYTTWNLDVLYDSFESEKLKVDCAELPKKIVELINFAKENFDKEQSEQEPQKTLECFVQMRNDFSKYFKILWYAGLTLEVNSEDIQAQKIKDTTELALSELVYADTAFRAYLLKLPNLEQLIESSEILAEHKFYLQEAKQKAAHMLSTQEELVFAKLKITGSNAWDTMRGQVISTLEVPININGEQKSLPLSKVRSMSEESDPYIRKSAYFAELAAYPLVEKPVAASLNAIKGEAITTAQLRKYHNVLAMTLTTSRMDKATLDALISTIEDALPIFRKYFKHKAKLLGHQDGGLPFYDIFAPVGSVNMTFSKQEAVDFVVKNFNDFSEDLGTFTKNACENDWIDWDPKKGKTGGAFCANLHPVGESRVLTNFSGSFGDVLTLAHELGHAYHGYALKDNSYLNSNYSMPIAEVASTFCEALVCSAALKQATKQEALVIMENNLQGMGQVIVDIYSRYLFETELIKRRKNGSLSVEELNDLMVDCQKKAYGDGLSTYHPYMWLCKVHYYRADQNFYNFPYAYGMLFAKGLYNMYQQQGKSFAQKYKELLAATGQNNLWQVGQIVNVNVQKKDFWQGALKEVEKEVEAFVKF